MSKQTKPKFKVLIFENAISEEAFGNYFDKLPISTILSSHRGLTKDTLKAVQNKYFAFVPNKIKQLHFNNAIPTREEFDIIIFAPADYERAGDFARRNPHIKIFVYAGPSGGLEYESEQNFTVCGLETMTSTIKEMYKEKYEHQGEDSVRPSGENEGNGEQSDDGISEGCSDINE
jgi:hypothetical protein